MEWQAVSAKEEKEGRERARVQKERVGGSWSSFFLMNLSVFSNFLFATN